MGSCLGVHAQPVSPTKRRLFLKCLELGSLSSRPRLSVQRQLLPHARQRTRRVPGHPIWAVAAGHHPYRTQRHPPKTALRSMELGKHTHTWGCSPKAEGTPGGVCLATHVTRDRVQAPLGTPHKASEQPGWSPLPLGTWSPGAGDTAAGPGWGSTAVTGATRAPSRDRLSAQHSSQQPWRHWPAPHTGVSAACRATGRRSPATPPLRSPQIHISPRPQPSRQQLGVLPGTGWGLSLLLGTKEGLASVE